MCRRAQIRRSPHYLTKQPLTFRPLGLVELFMLEALKI
jgi:hypothetical protein